MNNNLIADLASGRLPIEAELARRHLLDFTKFTFPGYRANWHHEVICEALEDLVFGDTNRLMIFTPARHGKSELVSRRLPAWYLGQFPDAEVMLASYSADLANRMNCNVQGIIDSREYRRVFQGVRLSQGVGDPARKINGERKKRTDDFFEIVGRRGSLRSAGVGGSITGMGFNLGIIDDPISNAEEAMSQIVRDKVWDWYTTTFYTRQTGFGGLKGSRAKILLTMTRWSDDDLAGRLLQLAKDEPEADQWKVVVLPALYDGTPSNAERRTKIGEVLWPGSQYDEEYMRKSRKMFPAHFWDAMFMQRPRAVGGNYFKRQLFGRYRRDGRTIHHYDNHWNLDDCRVWAAVDPASSEKSTGDYTAIAVVAEAPNGACILLDMVRERHAPTKIGGMMMSVVERWKPSHFIFEADGNQTAVVSLCRQEEGMPPIREVKHRNKGKLVRATRAIAMHEGGEILVPESAAWLEVFFDEAEAFTGLGDKHDDMIDALAYAVQPFARGNSSIAWAEQERGLTKPYQSTPLLPTSHAGGRKLWGRSR